MATGRLLFAYGLLALAVTLLPLQGGVAMPEQLCRSGVVPSHPVSQLAVSEKGVDVAAPGQGHRVQAKTVHERCADCSAPTLAFVSSSLPGVVMAHIIPAAAVNYAVAERSTVPALHPPTTRI